MLMVVYMSLQSFRATIIPTVQPVSLLGAFIMFPALGFSVNVLTMFGLVLRHRHRGGRCPSSSSKRCNITSNTA